MLYVIAYDIADDGRRQQVARFLEGWGRRVEKSVFECNVSREQVREIVAHLRTLVVDPEDRCHVYRVCSECVSHRLVIGEELEPSWPNVVVV
ncbi:CRISPR-associated endonuclease Cas2 [Desulfofundulus sp. TPOSR]|uniref:CRISPR-associated endonuclease Cas2 n=1 Tax=Desulfofundulus sp. TPOSR TaxID=2714340 RepID=UPI00140BD0C1|nr:CRISPR-associated endonuclease Cas2 [Desulfofundulus sp. TPOSR]NHM27883.1 CRISPR-associated endonuclease Cas2 [Desulfofundulus sp. TPOSR]